MNCRFKTACACVRAFIIESNILSKFSGLILYLFNKHALVKQKQAFAKRLSDVGSNGPYFRTEISTNWQMGLSKTERQVLQPPAFHRGMLVQWACSFYSWNSSSMNKMDVAQEDNMNISSTCSLNREKFILRFVSLGCPHLPFNYMGNVCTTKSMLWICAISMMISFDSLWIVAWSIKSKVQLDTLAVWVCFYVRHLALLLAFTFFPSSISSYKAPNKKIVNSFRNIKLIKLFRYYFQDIIHRYRINYKPQKTIKKMNDDNRCCWVDLHTTLRSGVRVLC